MKKLLLLAALGLSLSVMAQEKPKKQYRSAETGRYVSKSTADKNPSTTHSTTRKTKASSGTSTRSTSKRKKS